MECRKTLKRRKSGDMQMNSMPQRASKQGDSSVICTFQNFIVMAFPKRKQLFWAILLPIPPPPQIGSPQMWVWPQLVFGGVPPIPDCNWRTLPSSQPFPPRPLLPSFPHPIGSFCRALGGGGPGWWGGRGPRAQGGGGGGPPSSTSGQTHIWGYSIKIANFILSVVSPSLIQAGCPRNSKPMSRANVNHGANFTVCRGASGLTCALG